MEELKTLGKDKSSVNFQQVYLVYKFNETPINILVQGLQSKNPDEAKRFYKTVAKQLHPDKNSHPLAKEAFQKILKAKMSIRN